MTEQLEILHAGDTIGKVLLKKQGLYLHFSAECRSIGPGVHRLYLLGESGSHILGVMSPKGDLLVLEKKLSLREYTLWGLGTLKHCGFSGAVDAPPVIQQNPSPQWVTCEDPASLFTDAELAAACPAVDVLVCRQERRICLAFPLDPGAPFPMLPVFRFGHTERINERNYVVFELKNGVPC